MQDVKMIEPVPQSGISLCENQKVDEYNIVITSILLIGIGIWLAVVSFFVYKIYKLFSSLKDNITEDLSKKGFEEVRKRLNFLEEDGKKHSQKVSLLRFNPFSELGGDHSFCLVILDGMNSGMIITSLHTRDRTRVYIKEVKLGKSNTELSVEEKKALAKAINNK